MAFEIEAIVSAPEWDADLGEDPQSTADRAAAAVAAAVSGRRGAVGLLFASDEEVRALNRQFRGADHATNVLSFPAPDVFGALGDIALARETVCAEAMAQGKSTRDHALHLIVHGLLHLLGYDHVVDAEAERMEGLERLILERLGVADPYQGREG